MTNPNDHIPAYPTCKPPRPEWCEYQPGTDELIVWADGHEWYRLPMDRCATPEQLGAWIRHLAEKTWMTMGLVEHIIFEVYELRGWRLDITSARGGVEP